MQLRHSLPFLLGARLQLRSACYKGLGHMTSSQYGLHRYDLRPAAKEGIGFLSAMVVLSSVLFNPALAFINAQALPLTPAFVIAAEILCVAAAHLVALINYRHGMTPWYMLLCFMILIALFRSLALGTIEMKAFRDVLIIPTFVVLGMTFDQRALTQLIVPLHAVVLFFLALEAFDTDLFADLFKIQDYYINTRGYDPAVF